MQEPKVGTTRGFCPAEAKNPTYYRSPWRRKNIFAAVSGEVGLADYLASLEKVSQLDVELVLPSHGGAFRDHRHRAAQLIHHHEYRMLAALDAIRAKPRTSYAIAKEIFDFTEKAPVQVQLPATFETLAHLELLARQGRVTKIEEGDLLRFRAV